MSKDDLIKYRVPTAPAQHFIAGAIGSGTYKVTVSDNRRERLVVISHGGSMRASSAGVLTFKVSASGGVSQ
jgi:hypothetical protein